MSWRSWPKTSTQLNIQSQRIDFTGQLEHLGGKKSREPERGHGEHHSHTIWPISSGSALKSFQPTKSSLGAPGRSE